MEIDMNDYPILREKLGLDGFDELRRLISEEIARRPAPQPQTPESPRTVPGPDEDLRPRS
jgi:DNA-binding MurR/RpiR family transcriptional regulator